LEPIKKTEVNRRGRGPGKDFSKVIALNFTGKCPDIVPYFKAF